MEAEKAAIKRSLAQEARFREEKQQIVASLGGSAAELLTPSADSRLQRKLQNNSSRGSSSLLAQGSGRDYQDSLRPNSVPEQAAPSIGAIAVAAQVNEELPVPLDHSNEREQYNDDEVVLEEPKKCNKKVYLFAGGAFLALTIGSVIGVVVALLTRPSTSSSPSSTSSGGASNPANERCELDQVALAQCAYSLAVPDCAEAAYLELADTYMLGGEMCDSAHKGLVALAVAQTNYGDDILDPIAFHAMSTLYFALEGANWRDVSGWLNGSSPGSGSWYGVECSSTGSVLKIDLGGNKLQGTIPTEIGLLSTLISFSITSNNVSGSLPSEIGLLTHLQILSTRFTQINSSLPSEIGNLKELRQFIVGNCALVGTIPTEIGNLINLEILDFEGNQFSGTIPEELGDLVNLQRLEFAHLFGISGQFPPNLFSRLLNLEEVRMSLPFIEPSSFLQDLSMATLLRRLHIDDTDLTGSLPTEMGLLSDLVLLHIIFTDIEGTIPSEIGLLTKLSRLNLRSSTFVTGPLPSELGLLTNLEFLDISNTRISGTIPPEICALNLLPQDDYVDLSELLNTCN